MPGTVALPYARLASDCALAGSPSAVRIVSSRRLLLARPVAPGQRPRRVLPARTGGQRRRDLEAPRLHDQPLILRVGVAVSDDRRRRGDGLQAAFSNLVEMSLVELDD